MSNYHYENGANHYDYHKEYSICVKSVGDARLIIKELLNDDEEEVHFEEVVPKEEVIESSYNRNVSGEDLFALKMKKVTDTMWEEKVLVRKYDYAFLKMYMDKTVGYQKFKSSKAFLDFLQMAGCKNIPCKSTFDSYYDIKKMGDGKVIFANDRNEEERRNDIVARFIELMR